MKTILLASLLVLVGCPLHDPAPVSPDYPGGNDIVETFPDDSPEAARSPCGKACAHLKALSCPEGGPTCYRACVRQVRLERIPVACWTSAPTVADVRACGPQLRCLK
jgi:hypothetical protein